MTQTELTSNVQEFMTLILKRLDSMNHELVNQEELLKEHIALKPSNADFDNGLLAQIKSTRTSLELLRDEVEELHDVTAINLLKVGEHD